MSAVPDREVRPFPGAEASLAAHATLLPQPDQLCGPFSAHVALQALAGQGVTVPTMTALALASGTHVWPHDEPAWRPPGAPLDDSEWADLPCAEQESRSGTTAAGLVRGVPLATGAALAVVPVPSPAPAILESLLVGLLQGPRRVGVVAHVRTGPLLRGQGDATASWDVGHFVVLWGASPDGGRVGVADTYPELGRTGSPPGCRVVRATALAEAMALDPGRGLLLLVTGVQREATAGWVAAAGAVTGLWSV